ncbi:hypothetical protein Slin14017_G106580 [Septoria linicola]|nr:hypothetical protein Slin14017_G106580 [Septoria linicola]
MLFEQPAREWFDKLWKTCTEHIPTLLSSITNLMSKSPDQMQMDARARLNNIIDAGTDAALTALDHGLAALFAQCVQAGFTTANKTSWMARAQLRLDTWLTWHTRTVHAFCKRNGHWKRNGTRVSWNETIRRLFTNSLDVSFTSLNDDVQPAMNHFADNLNDSIFKRLHEDDIVAVLDPRDKNLRGTIVGQQDEFSTDLKDFLDTLRNLVEDIRLRCVLGGSGSYVHGEMQRSYALAASFDQKSYPHVRGAANKLLPGNSALADRIDTLRSKLSQPGPDNLFERVEARVDSDFDEGRKMFLNALSKRLAKLKAAIMDDFDSKYGIEGEEVSLAAHVATELATAAQHALRRLKQDIQPTLEQCKKLDDSGCGEP